MIFRVLKLMFGMRHQPPIEYPLNKGACSEYEYEDEDAEVWPIPLHNNSFALLEKMDPDQ